MSHRRAVWGRRLGFLAIGAALALVALELAVGRYFPVLGQVYRLDNELLHDAIPSARRIQPMHASRLRAGDTSRVLVRTDAAGFRFTGADPVEGAPRVLVLGDSFVMAENVTEDRTFAAQLGAFLGAAGAPVTVINAGRSGYGPDQELLLLGRDGPALQPDLIVQVLCAHNDLGDLMRNKLFRLGSGGELVRVRPTLGRRMRSLFEERAERAAQPALQRLWAFAQDGDGRRAPVNELPGDTLDLYLQALRAQFEEHVLRRDTEVVSLFEDVYDADVALHPESESSLAKVALFTAVIEATLERAGALGVPIRFVVVPSAVDVDPNFGLRVDRARFPDYEPTRLTEAVTGAITAVGGVAFDLTARFQSAEDPSAWFVGGTDLHWNAGGQRSCAEATAAWLLEDEGVRSALGAAR